MGDHMESLGEETMMGPSEFGRTNPEGVCEKRKTRDSLKLGKGMIWGVSFLRLNQLSKTDDLSQKVFGLYLEERGNGDGTSRPGTTSLRGVLQKKRMKMGYLKLEKGLFLGTSLLRLKIAFDNNRSFAKSSGFNSYPERELSMVGQWGTQGSVRIWERSDQAEGKDFSVLRRDDVRIRQNEHQVHTSFWDNEKILQIRCQICSWSKRWLNFAYMWKYHLFLPRVLALIGLTL